MKILDCNLPLNLQKLYIQRLKKMLSKHNPEKLSNYCPAGISFSIYGYLKPFKEFQNVCDFCMFNVDATRDCPCFHWNPEEAANRGREFIARFEKQHEEIK